VAEKIKQGDAVLVPIEVRLNGEALNVAEAETVEFFIGGYRKLWPGEAIYDEDDGCFYVPVKQEESFSWQENTNIAVDVRVRFRGGNVMGAERLKYAFVVDAVSEVKL